MSERGEDRIREILLMNNRESIDLQDTLRMIEYVKKFPELLAYISREEYKEPYLRDIVRHLKYHQVKAGDIFMRLGDTFDNFSLIMSGKLQCFHRKSEVEFNEEISWYHTIQRILHEIQALVPHQNQDKSHEYMLLDKPFHINESTTQALHELQNQNSTLQSNQTIIQRQMHKLQQQLYDAKQHFDALQTTKEDQKLLLPHFQFYRQHQQICMYRKSSQYILPFRCLGDIYKPALTSHFLLIAEEDTEIAYLQEHTYSKLFASFILQLNFIYRALQRIIPGHISKENVVRGVVFKAGEISREIFIVKKGRIVLKYGDRNVGDIIETQVFGHENSQFEKKRSLTAETKGNTFCTLYCANISDICSSTFSDIITVLFNKGSLKLKYYEEIYFKLNNPEESNEQVTKSYREQQQTLQQQKQSRSLSSFSPSSNKLFSQPAIQSFVKGYLGPTSKKRKNNYFTVLDKETNKEEDINESYFLNVQSEHKNEQNNQNQISTPQNNINRNFANNNNKQSLSNSSLKHIMASSFLKKLDQGGFDLASMKLNQQHFAKTFGEGQLFSEQNKHESLRDTKNDQASGWNRIGGFMLPVSSISHRILVSKSPDSSRSSKLPQEPTHSPWIQIRRISVSPKTDLVNSQAIKGNQSSDYTDLSTQQRLRATLTSFTKGHKTCRNTSNSPTFQERRSPYFTESSSFIKHHPNRPIIQNLITPNNHKQQTSNEQIQPFSETVMRAAHEDEEERQYISLESKYNRNYLSSGYNKYKNKLDVSIQLQKELKQSSKSQEPTQQQQKQYQKNYFPQQNNKNHVPYQHTLMHQNLIQATDCEPSQCQEETQFKEQQKLSSIPHNELQNRASSEKEDNSTNSPRNINENFSRFSASDPEASDQNLRNSYYNLITPQHKTNENIINSTTSSEWKDLSDTHSFLQPSNSHSAAASLRQTTKKFTAYDRSPKKQKNKAIEQQSKGEQLFENSILSRHLDNSTPIQKQSLNQKGYSEKIFKLNFDIEPMIPKENIDRIHVTDKQDKTKVCKTSPEKETDNIFIKIKSKEKSNIVKIIKCPPISDIYNFGGIPIKKKSEYIQEDAETLEGVQINNNKRERTLSFKPFHNSHGNNPQSAILKFRAVSNHIPSTISGASLAYLSKQILKNTPF